MVRECEKQHVLVIPKDSLQAEYLFRDRTGTYVRVTIGRPPISGHATAGGVVYELHRPSELYQRTGKYVSIHIYRKKSRLKCVLVRGHRGYSM